MTPVREGGDTMLPALPCHKHNAWGCMLALPHVSTTPCRLLHATSSKTTATESLVMSCNSPYQG